MIPVEDSTTPEEMNSLNGNFLCGVVEGFYGKPWSTDQRKKLFTRMKMMGMNTYLYAPKDDSKHRVYWRDLYSVEEADHLTTLIQAAEENAVDFVYALSPGLDITFSNSKDVMHLKRKLEQVASFGCKSFALLFDDIEVEMCEADKAVFQSFAHAQVSVSNETYQYLNQPKFLFCPTEYCATRAVPNVASSEYLTTLGAKLLPGIDVMWTGPRVVSKKISIQSIEEVSKVLKRAPVIWDNIHANDYDPKRVFLGPYDGRIPELIPYLRGVLTNPNCELEANYIAMHTLAQWCRSNQDGVKKDVVLSSSPVTADIKLETESDSSEDLFLGSQYQPSQALDRAVTDWLKEIHSECREPKKAVIIPEQSPIVPLPAVTGVTAPTIAAPVIAPQSAPVSIPSLLAQAVLGVDNINELSALAEVNGSMMQPTSLGPVNSLIDSASSDSENESVGEPTVEPMDCVISPGSSPVLSSINDPLILDDKLSTDSCSDCKSDSSDTMQVEPVPSSSTVESTTSSSIRHEEVIKIIELFYLPLDHGPQSVQLLNDFCWIKANAPLVAESRKSKLSPEKASQVNEWQERCLKFQNDLTSITNIIDRFCHIPNRALVYELFPYFWDMKETLNLIITFVKWMVIGSVPHISVCYMQEGPQCMCIRSKTSFFYLNKTQFLRFVSTGKGVVNEAVGSNRLYRDAFLSGDHEPWFFRGGLQAEFQRLIKVEGMLDLLVFTVPPIPNPSSYTVRPCTAQDESAVYDVCRKTCDDGQDGTEVFSDHPDLISDQLIGGILTLSPEFCFVVEDEQTAVAGYCLAALDAIQYSKKADIMWNTAMREKYPKPTKVEGLSPSEELMLSFHEDKHVAVPDMVYQGYPSRLVLSLLPEHRDNPCLARRLLLSCLAALKTNGCHGVHVEVPSSDRSTIAFYAKLGFFDIPVEGPIVPGAEDVTYMGRIV